MNNLLLWYYRIFEMLVFYPLLLGPDCGVAATVPDGRDFSRPYLAAVFNDSALSVNYNYRDEVSTGINSSNDLTIEVQTMSVVPGTPLTGESVVRAIDLWLIGRIGTVGKPVSLAGRNFLPGIHDPPGSRSTSKIYQVPSSIQQY